MSAEDAGYRVEPAMGAGPRIRSDVVDVYVFQSGNLHSRAPEKLLPTAAPKPAREDSIYLLQVFRAGPPLADSWHPVMGHIERGETAVQAMWRELREEVGLARSEVLGAWALEQVHPFFIAELDAIVMSPRFAAEVAPGWEPTLNDEHLDWRWVHADEAGQAFMWPGQIAACREIVERLLPMDSLMRGRVVL